MQITRTTNEPPAEHADLRKALFGARLSRFTQGLLATGLIEDVNEAPVTLLAPNDLAFDGMPWRFDELLLEPHLLEARFDLFEYLAIRGRASVEGPRTAYTTLQGDTVRLGNRLVYGRFGAARVLQSIHGRGAVIHVLEHCVYPWDPKVTLARRSATL